jgi:NADH dehydrogenase
LPSFPEKLSAKAARAIEGLGVELRLGAPVTDVDAMGVRVRDHEIAARTIIWAAGVETSPAARWLGAEADRAGRVIVDERLRVPGHEAIFVIGDTAAVAGPDGRPLPGVAPVAKQQGAFVARAIQGALAGHEVPAFRYRNAGDLATIGRSRAVADFGRLRLSGWIAWVVWCVAHIYFLVGFRDRFAVSLTWAWNYITYQRSARLITGEVWDEPDPKPALAA